MKKIKMMIMLLMAMIIPSIAFSQSSKDLEAYNISKGLECLNNGDADGALNSFLQELKVNPSNGYAMILAAYLYSYDEAFGTALTYANNSLKKLPKSDKTYQGFAYRVRGDIYLGLNDTLNAVKDYTSAIYQDPENADYFEVRANLYYYMDEYDLAEKDYKTLIQLNPGNVMGYMGIGRNLKTQKRYEDAIKQFDYAIKLAPTYSHGYAFRAEAYYYLKRYALAADDVVESLKIDGNDKAFYLMQQISEDALELMVSKVKAQMKKEQSEAVWPYYIAIIYEYSEKYDKAIEYYEKALENDKAETIYSRIASCNYYKGDFERCIEYCDIALSMDSTNNSALNQRANAKLELNMFDEAISDISKCIDMYPDYYFYYYRRGWIKDNSNDVEGAIEDYSMAVSLEPEYAYPYCGRGKLLLQIGKKKEADDDFNKIIELESEIDINDVECLQYAYYYLGNKEKAIEVMQQLLENNSVSNYYDASCLYSLLGEKDKSLGYLRLALETGFNRFSHIDRDSDLDNVRDSQEFKDLIAEFRTESGGTAKKDAIFVEKTSEIPFTKEGDMCKVECEINGLHLHFIFDTGASTVSISSVEATFMLKNNYLSSQDMIGTQNYLNANGELSEGTVINLRKVKIGDLTLNNVRASVVKNQRAPLLLGQSVLNRLGKIEIDNERKMIKVSYKVEE